MKEDVPDLGGTNVQIPPSLDRIVRHGLEKNPAERFQSARDVARPMGRRLRSSARAASVKWWSSGRDEDL